MLRPRRLLALSILAVCAGCGGDREAPATTTVAPSPRQAAAKPDLCGSLRARVVGRVEDPEVEELSGLVRSRAHPGLLFAHEDSGAGPVLEALRGDGALAGRMTVAGAAALDWEDIAAAPGPDGEPLLYVGDIGDNAGERASIDIYRVAEPAVGPTATAPAARLTLRYPDGAHDAEALLADPLRDELVIVTKGLLSGRAYSVSSLRPAGSRTTLRRGPAIDLGLVTAGDVSADGRVVALRSYDRLAVWRRRGREPLTRTLARAPCLSPTSLGGEGQGEALALDARGTTALTVPEGRRPALRRYAPARR